MKRDPEAALKDLQPQGSEDALRRQFRESAKPGSEGLQASPACIGTTSANVKAFRSLLKLLCSQSSAALQAEAIEPGSL